MAIFGIIVLGAVLPAVFAIPQHGHMGHGFHKARGLPSGIISSGFPHPSGIPGSAPYPAQNATAIGPTGTGGAGSGPITIQSTINIVPYPSTHTEYQASSTAGIGEAGASSSAGSGGSGSGSGSGSGGSGGTCGPATVTVTQANTVTVTVGGGAGGAPSKAPVQSSPAGSASAAPSSAPYPIGNSSVPVGPSGTASVGTGLPSIPKIPVPVSTSAAPVEAATSASSSAVYTPNTYHVTQSIVPTSSVVANAYYHAPEHHHSSAAPVASSSASEVSFPAPVASTSATSAPVEAATTAPSVTPVASSSASQVASSAPVSSSSSSVPVKTDSGLKARGLLYGVSGGSLSDANAYLEGGNGAMGWGWNWDSSATPQSGQATGSLNVQFVPMLLSAADVHTTIWDGNSAGHPYLMGFNEPDMTTDKGGSQMDVPTCVSNWKQYMEPKRSGSVKLISPGTTNNLDDTAMGVHYMSDFLAACNGCHFDVLAFHYYGEASDINALKTTVQKYQALQTQYSIPELWITEMAPNELPTADQMSAFLEFLDDASNGVARYAFNGLNTGTGQSLDNTVIKTAYCS